MTQENIKDRNIQNVTTFVGQFYGFIVEYAFLLAFLIWTTLKNDGSDHLKAYFTILKFIDFGLLSAIEFYSSPILKKFMKMKWIILSGQLLKHKKQDFITEKCVNARNQYKPRKQTIVAYYTPRVDRRGIFLKTILNDHRIW